MIRYYVFFYGPLPGAQGLKIILSPRKTNKGVPPLPGAPGLKNHLEPAGPPGKFTP